MTWVNQVTARPKPGDDVGGPRLFPVPPVPVHRSFWVTLQVEVL